jgi:hypothetical protein
VPTRLARGATRGLPSSRSSGEAGRCRLVGRLASARDRPIRSRRSRGPRWPPAAAYKRVREHRIFGCDHAPRPGAPAFHSYSSQSTRNMSRAFWVILVVALAVSSRSAASAQVGAGITAGLNSSTITGPDTPELRSLTGMVLGSFVRYPRTGILTIQPEVLLSQKGAIEDINQLQLHGKLAYLTGNSEPLTGRLSDVTTVAIDLSYLEIPILIRLSVPAGQSRFQTSVATGPAFAWEVRCRVSYWSHAEKSTTQCQESRRDSASYGAERRRLDTGWIFGGSLEIVTGTSAILIQGRYTLGLYSLDTRSGGHDLRHRSSTFAIGYRWR